MFCEAMHIHRFSIQKIQLQQKHIVVMTAQQSLLSPNYLLRYFPRINILIKGKPSKNVMQNVIFFYSNMDKSLQQGAAETLFQQ